MLLNYLLGQISGSFWCEFERLARLELGQILIKFLTFFGHL